MSLCFAIQDIQKQVSLEAEYDRFNRAYFDSSLPPVKLSWERSKNRGGVAMAMINRQTKEIRPTEIRLSVYMKMDRARFDAIMLHEMIHIWQFVNHLNDGHGSHFLSMRRTVSAKSGVDILMTEEIETQEVSEDIQSKTFVVVLVSSGGTEKMMILSLSAKADYDKLQEVMRSMATYSVGEFWSGIYESEDRELLKFPVMRKLPTTGSYRYYKPVPGMFERIKSEGKLIAQVTSKTIRDMTADVSRMIGAIARFTVKRLEKDYIGSEFSIEEGNERYKVWTVVKSVRGSGSINIEGKAGYNGLSSVTVGLWNGTNQIDTVSTVHKYPTPAMIDEFVDKALAGKPQMVEWMFGVSQAARAASEILRVARMLVSGYIAFDDLPIETQGDIIATVEEKFQTDDARDNLIGLANPPMFLVRDMPLDRIIGYNRKPSEVAVRKYVKMLEAGSEAPPILVDGNRFLDGGHRFAAYRMAGRETIPTVDIGRLLRMWKDWVEGGADELSEMMAGSFL